MKTATFSSRGASLRIRILALSLGIALAGLYSKAEAISVDSEIVLLVDVTDAGLNKHDFRDVMNGYAAAMTSSQVLDSIASGSTGRIAVSLVFYGNSTTQSVGIPWMMISNVAEARQFATIAQNLARPLSIASPSLAAVIDLATNHFGTETGGSSNGYESAVQILEVAAASTPTNPAAVKQARDEALASGVDVINAVAIGNNTKTIQSFFQTNVVGGELAGHAGSTTTTKLNSLDLFLASNLGKSIQDGGTVSTSVPEPSSALLMSCAGFLLLRRRRAGASNTAGA
ncbi:DUF1194 domain-containing protein [Luteolibacter luteus]|uniref:DUF1194 domain-containing protein n=1 Tax=Luteolibacter luteus TaxID=2728835 RepID=A0A858RFG2_9BACT|nr:DUF1194 domain-containing protein [Luteolibacter luteus]QJE95587.1 DUF1194 domain-containing protein [Luteolibacter luteus]